MGYTKHNAIIVTGMPEGILKAHIIATQIFYPPQVSGICSSPINGYESFFIAPDGSKEGWEDSTKGDQQRAQFYQDVENIDEIDSVVEVTYGGDYAMDHSPVAIEKYLQEGY